MLGRFKAGMGAVALVLGLVAGGAGQGLAAPPPPDGTLTRTETVGTTLLRLDGVITRGVERRLAEAIRTLPHGRPVVLELSSPGGYTAAGYAMMDLLMAERTAGRPVATRVRAGESCESMCVGLFLTGWPRYAAPNSVFMVHAPRVYETGAMTLRTTRTMVERLVTLGASSTWIERVTAEGGFSGRIDYRRTAGQLATEGANLVTDLLH